MYIIKYANLHQTVMGQERPEQETDQSHPSKFLTFHKIMWKYQEKYVDEEYHRGTTLQDLFLKVTEKESGQQLAEGVVLAHSAPKSWKFKIWIMK